MGIPGPRRGGLWAQTLRPPVSWCPGSPVSRPHSESFTAGSGGGAGRRTHVPGGYQAPIPGRPPGSRDGVGGDVPPLPEGRALRWRVAPRPSHGSQPDTRRGTHACWASDTVTRWTSSRYNICNSCRQGRGSCTTVSCNATYRRHDVMTPSVRIGSGASTRQSPGALPHASASRGLVDPGPEVAPSSARSGPQVATAPALRCDAVCLPGNRGAGTHRGTSLLHQLY